MNSLYERFCSPSFICHRISSPDRTREQTAQFMAMVCTAFPDAKVNIDDMIAGGDKVVVRYTFQGTHNGTYMGILATGKRIKYQAVEIFKIGEGKAVENWIFPDMLGIMTQLGIISSPAPKK